MILVKSIVEYVATLNTLGNGAKPENLCKQQRKGKKAMRQFGRARGI